MLLSTPSDADRILLDKYTDLSLGYFRRILFFFKIKMRSWSRLFFVYKTDNYIFTGL